MADMFEARLNGRVKTAFVVGLVLVLIVVGAYFLFSPKKSDASPKEGECILSETKPQTFSPKSIATQDAKTLIKFSGYIETHDSHFLPVDINHMSRVDGKDGFIHLAGECIKLEIDFQKDAQNIATLSNLKYEFKSNTQGSKESYANCEVDAFAHKFPADKNHYSCLEAQEYQCTGKDKDGKPTVLAKLVIEILELELDGDEEKISAGTFSKPEFVRSCSQ